MNRRDLLKMFGVGGSVIPVVGGALQLHAESKLIEAPNVQPIITPSTTVIHPYELLNNPKGKLQVSYTANGQRYWFTADTFLTETTVDTIGIGPIEFMPVRSRMNWTLRGEFIGAAKVS